MPQQPRREVHLELGHPEAIGLAERFFNTIGHSGLVPPHESDASVALAVLCTLAQRVPALPPPLGPLLQRCSEHRPDREVPGGEFDRTEFVRRVAEHLHVAPARADLLIRVVFHAVRTELITDPADQRRVAKDLPPELRSIWERV